MIIRQKFSVSMPEHSQSIKHIFYQTTRSKMQELLVHETRCWIGGATARECELAGKRLLKIPGALSYASQASRSGEQGNS